MRRKFSTYGNAKEEINKHYAATVYYAKVVDFLYS